jgi:hypothetical protein
MRLFASSIKRACLVLAYALMASLAYAAGAFTGGLVIDVDLSERTAPGISAGSPEIGAQERGSASDADRPAPGPFAREGRDV